MENRNQSRFDERAALENLERFRADIERYRAERQAVSEEFEQFVRSFKNPQRATPAAPPRPPAARNRPIQDAPPPGPERAVGRAAAIPAVPPDRAPAGQISAGPPAPVDVTPPPVASVDVTPAPVATPAVPPAPGLPVWQRLHGRTPALLGGALILVAAGGWITWVKTRGADAPASAPVPDVRSTAPRGAQVVPEPPVQPSTTTSELITTGPVWVRVLADGQRVVERELPANARVPLTAEKTIVIRAGNAGAVRLTLAGQDQGVLGAEGTVVTRTFTVPRNAR